MDVPRPAREAPSLTRVTSDQRTSGVAVYPGVGRGTRPGAITIVPCREDLGARQCRRRSRVGGAELAGRVRAGATEVPAVRVGVDFESVTSIGSTLEKFGDAYLGRVFNQGEVAWARQHPATAQVYLTGRFALREAVLKLIETDDSLVRWGDVVVEDRESGPPAVRLINDSERRARALGINMIHLSVGRAGDLVAAVAVADSDDAKEESL